MKRRALGLGLLVLVLSSTLEGPFLGDARQHFAGPLFIARDGDLITLPADGGALQKQNLL